MNDGGTERDGLRNYNPVDTPRRGVPVPTLTDEYSFENVNPLYTNRT